MTKLEKEAVGYADNILKDVNCTLGNPRARHINSLDVEEAYLAGAEPREKQIAELEETINKLREQFALRYDLEDKIKVLEQENAELKCECRRCVYTDCPCILSDYGKDRNGICDHFKDVFDEIVELKDEQKELLKDTAIYDSMLTKAKTLLQKVSDVCGYPNYDIPVELYADIADFIKDSEVEK